MRRLACSAIILATLAAAPALAAIEAPYTPTAFQAAQAAGEPILVWIRASWCPTCKAQAPILSKLEAEPRYKDLHVFTVDFDSQKDVVRAMRVQMQSTLVAFHGSQETARSTGQTDATVIGGVVAKTAG